MTDKTDLHAILALALDPDVGELELACTYHGFTLGGEPITMPDLLLVARNSRTLTDQLHRIQCVAQEMLEHVERSGA